LSQFVRVLFTVPNCPVIMCCNGLDLISKLQEPNFALILFGPQAIFCMNFLMGSRT
jgi:hypothetical protein